MNVHESVLVRVQVLLTSVYPPPPSKIVDRAKTG